MAMTVSEIKKELVSRGANSSDFVGKKKEELMTMLKEDIDSDTETDFNFVEEDDNILLEANEDAVNYDVVPERDSEEWHDYVMSLLRDDEKADGRPKVHGLRRITKLLIGPILHDEADIVGTPNESYAVGKCKIVVFDEVLQREITFADVGDTHAGNTPKAFTKHSAAVAGTKAESRAFRKLLGLKGISAEEAFNLPKATEGKMIDRQVRAIDIMCKRLNVNANKFIGKDINEVSYESASKMIQDLGVYQQDTSKISSEIIGYEENWSK